MMAGRILRITIVYTVLSANIWQSVIAGFRSNGRNGGEGAGGYGGGYARSFSQFSGPVVGHATPVIVRSSGSAGVGRHGGSGGFGSSASSYSHFNGPVVGQAQPVIVRSAESRGFVGLGGSGNHVGVGGLGFGGFAVGHGFGGSSVGHGTSGSFGSVVNHGGNFGAGNKGGYGGHQGTTIDYVAHPRYNYGYGVNDFGTGDSHSQHESRDGDSVVGHYSLQEPSGNVRTVKYYADNNGFHAHVQNSGTNNHVGANQDNDKGW